MNGLSTEVDRNRRAAWRQSAENARLRHRKRKPLMAFTASTVKWMKLDRGGKRGRKGAIYIYIYTYTKRK